MNWQFVSAVKSWSPVTPLLPNRCAWTDRMLWLESCYRGSTFDRAADGRVCFERVLFIDKKELQTLILKGVIGGRGQTVSRS